MGRPPKPERKEFYAQRLPKRTIAQIKKLATEGKLSEADVIVKAIEAAACTVYVVGPGATREIRDEFQSLRLEGPAPRIVAEGPVLADGKIETKVVEYATPSFRVRRERGAPILKPNAKSL